MAAFMEIFKVNELKTKKVRCYIIFCYGIVSKTAKKMFVVIHIKTIFVLRTYFTSK